MYREIEVSQIVEIVQVRKLNPNGVELLRKNIAERGYNKAKPVKVVACEGGFILIDGNHRLEAVRALEMTTIPAIIEDLATDFERLKVARQDNYDTESIIPTNFVDDAELVWSLRDKHTQDEISDVMGWSREKVKNYSSLSKIDEQAWGVIGTTFENNVPNTLNDDVPKIGTVVPIFTETLLRNIIQLDPAQQLELVTDLADGNIKKSQFKKIAEHYRAINERKEQLLSLIGDLPEEYQQRGLAELEKGATNVERIAETLRAEYEQKTGIVLIQGDFETEVLNIADESVDMILTDPPYGISTGHGITKKGDKNVTANFDTDEDAWDTIDKATYLILFRQWAEAWYRIARPGAVLITFTSRRYLSHVDEILTASGFEVRTPIIWFKHNAPPSSLVRKIPISSFELMFMAVKPGQPHAFNDSKTWDRRNVIQCALCGGNERLKDEKGETLHPTQKPECLINPLVEVFSNYGDVVFDGFMGTGTTGACAKAQGRKFIGIERNPKFFEATQRRLAWEK